MINPTTIVPALVGLTTLQVLWKWLADSRPFTWLSLLIWFFFLALLLAYRVLLGSERISRPLKRLHIWMYGQVTAAKLLGLAVLFAGAYAAWYGYQVWGELLTKVNYGTFFYRYTLLDQIFPRFVAYNPKLNGGYETIDLLETGSVNLFLLTYPISALFSVETALKVQPILLVLLLPALLYLSGRLIRFSHMESLLCACFALVMTPLTQGGFMEKLFHGTLPYLLSCEVAVVVFALSYRVFILGKSASWGISLIVLLGSLGALHPIFFLVMAPVALAVVFFGTIQVKKKATYCALIGAGFLIINAGWMYEVVAYGSGELITGHIDPSQPDLADWLVDLERSFSALPVVLLIGSVVGMNQLLRARETEKVRLGKLLLFAILFYALLGAVGHFIVAPVKPARFLVPFSFFLALALGPSWETVRSFWTTIEAERSPGSFIRNAALCLLTIFLCLPYSLYFVGIAVAPASTYQLVQWVREKAVDGGRIFFYTPAAGANATPYGAQVSFFQAITDRDVMGVPRNQMARGHINWIQEIGECLKKSDPLNCRDLYNIRYAVRFVDNELDAFRSAEQEQLEEFKLVETLGRIQIYESKRPGSYFLIGRGEVRQSLNRVSVNAEPSKHVVLKFFWVPGLRTEPSLAVEPYPLPNGKAFIKVHSDHHRSFEVIYR